MGALVPYTLNNPLFHHSYTLEPSLAHYLALGGMVWSIVMIAIITIKLEIARL